MNKLHDQSLTYVDLDDRFVFEPIAVETLGCLTPRQIIDANKTAQLEGQLYSKMTYKSRLI